MLAHPTYPITAWSAVNALGRSTETVLRSLSQGKTGLGACPLELPVETIVGAIPGVMEPLPPAFAAYDCRIARIGLLALRDVESQVRRARERYGATRIGIILGTSTGGLLATEANHAAFRTTGNTVEGFDLFRQHSFNALGELYREILGLEGPCYTISTACSSSAKAMAAAARLLDLGVIDAALVGGGDSLTRMTLQGFHGLGILDSEPCRPFDQHRAGINIGEGVALQLLERSGDSPVYFLGAGESADAHHMSSPHPEGRGAREAMKRALERTGLEPEDVDHINAHGTATRLNDRSEAIAIRSDFGNQIPVASTKGYTGHLLGGAGATELTFALHAVITNEVPKTLGYTTPDPELDLNVTRAAIQQPVRRVLSNSFAFGGSNVSILVGERP